MALFLAGGPAFGQSAQMQSALEYINEQMNLAAETGSFEDLDQAGWLVKQFELKAIDFTDPAQIAMGHLLCGYMFVKSTEIVLSNQYAIPLEGKFGRWTPTEQTQYYFEKAAAAAKKAPPDAQSGFLFYIGLGHYFQMKMMEESMGARPEEIAQKALEALTASEGLGEANPARQAATRAIKSDLLFNSRQGPPLDQFEATLQNLIYGRAEEGQAATAASPEFTSVSWRFSMDLPARNWEVRETYWPAYRMLAWDGAVPVAGATATISLFASRIPDGAPANKPIADSFDEYIKPLTEVIEANVVERKETTLNGIPAVQAVIQVGASPPEIEPEAEEKDGTRPLFGRKRSQKRPQDLPKQAPGMQWALYLNHAGIQYLLVLQSDADRFEEALKITEKSRESFVVY